MSTSGLIGERVELTVSDPWEFGTECGVGPFRALVTSVGLNSLLLHLDTPIQYRGVSLLSVLASPRYAGALVGDLVSEGGLTANLRFLCVEIGALENVTKEMKAGMVPAIGSIVSPAQSIPSADK